MAYRDLRDWLTMVEDLGQLRRVSGAHWNLEMGAISRIAHEQPPPHPAILFDCVPEYPRGYQVLTGILSSLERVALTMGASTDLGPLELVGHWQHLWRNLRLTPTQEVEKGPLLQNLWRGDDIDLGRFPSPHWHEHDGGRYIGTGGVTITRDPEEGWVNLGTYRVQVHDRDLLTVYISPGKHGRIHREKYFARGEPCPVAISFGQDPLLLLLGTTEMPPGTSEYEFAGGIRGAPIEVIRGPHTGLPLPATAEIVVEGEFIPGESRMEGPFGEALGYYASGEHPEPAVKVKTIMYRDDPIICGVPPSRPPNEETFARAVIKSAMIWDALTAAGVPEVRGVWCHEVGIARLFNVISLKQRYAGHAKQAAMAALGSHAGAYMSRYVVVVDDDIDPSDMEAVLWAVTTRSDPERSIDVVRRGWSGPLDAAIPPEMRGFNSVAIIDACKPYEWLDRFPRAVETSPELRARVLEKFANQFLGGD